MTDDRQRAMDLICHFCDMDPADYYDEMAVTGAEAVEAITAALRAAPEGVALRTAMRTLEQIANAPDDQGAKFNAAATVAFLKTQGAGGPEGFVMMPVEPTEEMITASLLSVPIFKRINPGQHLRVYGARAWAAMLAARPQGVNDA